MFIRRTQTRNRTSGEPYSTYRLVESSRMAGSVKQTTLLNLGSHFDLPQQEWAALARHIDELYRGQRPLVDGTLSETGHLFISVLAYHFVHTLRLQLKGHGVDDSWETLRETLATQQRVTATLQRRDGRTVHVRKATRPEPHHQRINVILGHTPNPGGIHRVLVQCAVISRPRATPALRRTTQK
jgi:hypothetical protein